jgi:hypothetical protein
MFGLEGICGSKQVVKLLERAVYTSLWTYLLYESECLAEGVTGSELVITTVFVGIMALATSSDFRRQNGSNSFNKMFASNVNSMFHAPI